MRHCIKIKIIFLFLLCVHEVLSGEGLPKTVGVKSEPQPLIYPLPEATTPVADVMPEDIVIQEKKAAQNINKDDKIDFLKKDSSNSFSGIMGEKIWVAIGFFGSLCLLGLLLITVKNRRQISQSKKNDRPMSLVSSLSFGPKRQLHLVKIRNAEFVFSCTEQGMQFMTPLASSHCGAEMNDFPKFRRAQVQEKESQALPSAETNVSPQNNPSIKKNSEILTNALNKLKRISQEEKIESDRLDNKEDASENSQKSEKNAMGTFPKYLANAFEQEAHRDLSGQSAAENADEKADQSDELDNVANMIRQKLKSMKTLGS